MMSKVKFLVVDDLSAMRRMIRAILRELNFVEIEEAEHGLAALHRLRQTRFDFVLTDWNMPHMDGLALLRHIRSDPALQHLPVMLVSAEAKKENVLAAAQAGASGYIVKPFNADTLHHKLSLIFDRHGLRFPHAEQQFSLPSPFLAA